MIDYSIVTFDPISTYRWIRTRLGTARTPLFDAQSMRLLLTGFCIDCFVLAIVLPMLSVPLLMGDPSAAEWFVIVGLLTGHILALFAGWMCVIEDGQEESPTGPDQLSENVIFSVLKNRRRREALRYLRRAEGKASLRNLAEYVAAEENNIETDELTSAQRKRVYTTLYQCHLPMMDDEGILKYNQNRGRVELLDAASELFEHIDDTAGANAERRWGPVSLGLTIGVSVFVIIGLLISPLMGSVWLWLWAILSVSSLLVLALVSG